MHYETRFKEAQAQSSIQIMVESTLSSIDKTTVGMALREGQKELVQLHCTEAIATYLSLLPASRSLQPNAILTIGEYFTDIPELKHLTLDELKTFFQFAFKQQRYGKLYGGFGYDTLLDWFNQFWEERLTAIIDYRENQHNNRTAYEKSNRYRSEGDAFGIGEILKDNENKAND